MQYKSKWIWNMIASCLLVAAVSGFASAQRSTSDTPATKNLASAALPASGSPHSTTRIGVVPPENFVIGDEDVLVVNVWKEPEISRAVPVRSDGKISLPLVGEVEAAGRTPKQLESEIIAGLKPYMSEPEVTVIVQEIKSLRFNILGHVQRPGSYLLSQPTTIIDAIAMAGGFRDFAKVKKIYVLRAGAGGRQTRIRFNYKSAIRGSHPEQNVTLEPRDTIVVP